MNRIPNDTSKLTLNPNSCLIKNTQLHNEYKMTSNIFVSHHDYSAAKIYVATSYLFPLALLQENGSVHLPLEGPTTPP